MLLFVTGGDDYEPGPFNVTIPAGEISVPFNISITDDNVFEGNRSFNLIIHSKPLLHRLSLQPDCMLIVTIVDDDGELHISRPESIMVKFCPKCVQEFP